MSPKISFIQPAEENERWSDEAAKSMIGQSFLASEGNDAARFGVVLAARVADDGKALELTVEWPENGRFAEALREIRGLSRGPVDGDTAKRMGQMADVTLSQYEKRLDG